MSRGLVHLVEDEQSLRVLLRRLLVSSGYEVAEYASGDDFLSCKALRPGCVLLDVNMPGADGFAVQRALRARGLDWPVVMMTGAGDVTVLALKAGAIDLMNKPFGRSELLSAIEEAFRAASPAKVEDRRDARAMAT